MLKNYLKIALRNLQKGKIYSVINIAGLGVGMTAFILIALLLQYEFSFNKFQKNYNRIYRLQQYVHYENEEEWTVAPYPAAMELKNRFPEVDQAAVINIIMGQYLSSRKNIIIKEDRGYFADEDILKIFSFNFIEGSPFNSLSSPGQVVICRSLAKKLFPGEKALGKIIKGSIAKDLMITGVIEDYPENSNLKPDYLVSFSTVDGISGSEYKNNWNNNSFDDYLLLKENADPDELNSKIKNLFNEKIKNANKTLYLKPLSDIHLKSTRENTANSPLPYYAAVALFILILACINFINLTTARSDQRAKEIGVRKVVGGSRVSLIAQFISESVLVSFMALVIAFILVELYLPVFNSCMKTQLTLGYTKDWKFIIFIFIIFGMVGIFSGLYPAFYLSSFEPVSIIKGNVSKSGRESKGILRRILVAFQFVISISLILTTLFINKQVNYIKNKDLGFNKANLLRCFIDKNNSKSDFTELRNVLLTNPSIVNASVSSYVPFHSGSGREINWEGAIEGKKIAVNYNEVDCNFINTFKMKIIKGRNFSKEFLSDKNACLINETFASIVGWNNPIGKKLWDNNYNVIGVIKDFHPYSVHNKIPPCLLTLSPAKLSNENEYCVKISPNNIPSSIEFVSSTLKRFFPDKLFEVQLFDNDLDSNTMAVWDGVQNTFGFFSVLAIIIAVIGLLGLVSFTIQRRTKEIGIRKVLGASMSGLYLIIIREFIIILLIAIIIAAPSAYIIIKTTPGAYKPVYTAGDFILPLFGIIAFTALVTLQQVLGAVTGNPVKSMKYE